MKVLIPINPSLQVWFYQNCHNSVLFEMFWFLANSRLTPSPIPFEWTPFGGKVLPGGESLMELSQEPRFLTSWEKLGSWLAPAWPPAAAVPAGPWTPRRCRWCHDSPRSSLSAEDLAHCMCLGHKDKLLPSWCWRCVGCRPPRCICCKLGPETWRRARGSSHDWLSCAPRRWWGRRCRTRASRQGRQPCGAAAQVSARGSHHTRSSRGQGQQREDRRIETAGDTYTSWPWYPASG